MTEEFAQELIAFNKEVGAEDDVLTDSVQRGLLGGIPERGRFLTNSEHLVVHFQKLIVNAMTGEPVGRSTPVAAATAAPTVSRTIPLLPDASAIPDSERNAYVPLEIFKIEPESEIISSFYLRRADGHPLEPWEPGPVPADPGDDPGPAAAGACGPTPCRRRQTPITTGCRSGGPRARRWSPAFCTPKRSRAYASRR